MNKIKLWIKTSKGKSIAIISITAIVILLVALFTVCGKDGKTNTKTHNLFNNKQEIAIKKSEKPGLTLEEYNGGYFTMTLPKGWKIDTVGKYETFGFKAYDPVNPNYQIFYYGKLEPFMKSQKAKNLMSGFAKVTTGMGYEYFGDAPVLNPATAKQLFTIWPQIRQYASVYGKEYNFTALNNFKIIEELPYKSLLSSAAANEGMVRAHFTSSGTTTNEGLFAASIMIPGSYNVSGADTVPMMAYSVMGIFAPENEFLYLEKDLAKALSSLKLSDSYVQQGIQQNNAETQSILNNMKQMSAAYESYNNAWSERQTTYDVISQKNSDATLGYDRVIDTDTGEIYKAELGFYDSYNSNKVDYKNQNLELVTNNSDYLKPVDGYIYK